MELWEYAETIAAVFGFPLKYEYSLMETVMTVYDETVINVLCGDMQYYLEMLEVSRIDSELPSAINVLYDITEYSDLNRISTPYIYKVHF